MLANMTWDELLVDRVVDVGWIVLAAGILLCLVVVVRGPHLADRAIALDTISIHVVGLLLLLTLRIDSLLLFDGALVLSLVGFAGTVGVAQYIMRSRVQRVSPPPAPAEPPKGGAS